MLGKKLGTVLIASAALVAAFAAPSAAAGQPDVSGQEFRTKVNQVHIWEDGVKVRTGRNTTTSKVVRTVNIGKHNANCQQKGDRVTVGQWTNTWWVWLPETTSGKGNGGWVTAVYVSGGNNNAKIAGIPDC